MGESRVGDMVVRGDVDQAGVDKANQVVPARQKRLERGTAKPKGITSTSR